MPGCSCPRPPCPPCSAPSPSAVLASDPLLAFLKSRQSQTDSGGGPSPSSLVASDPLLSHVRSNPVRGAPGAGSWVLVRCYAARFCSAGLVTEQRLLHGWNTPVQLPAINHCLVATRRLDAHYQQPPVCTQPLPLTRLLGLLHARSCPAAPRCDHPGAAQTPRDGSSRLTSSPSCSKLVRNGFALHFPATAQGACQRHAACHQPSARLPCHALLPACLPAEPMLICCPRVCALQAKAALVACSTASGTRRPSQSRQARTLFHASRACAGHAREASRVRSDGCGTRVPATQHLIASF